MPELPPLPTCKVRPAFTVEEPAKLSLSPVRVSWPAPAWIRLPKPENTDALDEATDLLKVNAAPAAMFTLATASVGVVAVVSAAFVPNCKDPAVMFRLAALMRLLVNKLPPPLTVKVLTLPKPV